MQRLKEKELQELREKQSQIKQQYQSALESLMEDESLRILLKFCNESLPKLQNTTIADINDYSPVVISRLVFDKELSQIKALIENYPNRQCPLEHFLAIMLKVVKLPFEKTPLFLMGMKEMFKEMKLEGKGTVNYQQIENYIMGQVVSLSDGENHDTEFEIHFSENKMQDFLMHDNGVKKIHYSKDLKRYLVLDNEATVIKVYDLKMKIVAKFEPNKDKHSKKRHKIVNFDFNEMGSKLGLSMDDNTFSIISLSAFLSTPSPEEFRLSPINQVVYRSDSRILSVAFMAMMNRWLTINENNEMWVYDVEKLREEHESYRVKVKHPNDDFEITKVVEVVPMALVAIVLGNEVHFYSETMSKKKFRKFSHCEVITDLQYVEESNHFYLSGRNEKYLTIFSMSKTTGETKIWSFRHERVITQFEVFPFHGVLTIVDDKNNVKVYREASAELQYEDNYDLIVKNEELPLRMVKISKTEFILHSTYILVMELGKVAIERDTDYNFLRSFYLDHNKDELYFSLNDQIMSLSLLHGEMRKNLAADNSNLDRHKAFYLGKKTELFAIDRHDSLLQVFSKSDPKYQENKDHRKAPGIVNMRESFYDEEFRMVLMLAEDSIYQVRNDGQNNFTVRSTLLFEHFPAIRKWAYCPKSRHLWLCDSENTVYQMCSTTYEIKSVFKFAFPKQSALSERVIVEIAYDSEYGIVMLFTNLEELFVVSEFDHSQQLYINIKEVLPVKLRENNKFKSYQYQKTNYGKECFVFLYAFNEDGFLAELKIETALQQFSKVAERGLKYDGFVPYVKDTHQIQYKKVIEKKQTIELSKGNSFKLTKRNSIYIKTHNREVVFARKVNLEGMHLLTIGSDGHIKLWGENRRLFFDLKLPLLLKIEWDMTEIQDRRNDKNIKEVMSILQRLKLCASDAETGEKVIKRGKSKLRTNSEKIKLDLDNPIQVEIENRDLEELIKEQETISFARDILSKAKSSPPKRNPYMNMTQRVSEPWRKKKEFVKIYDKASSIDKYKEKMPFDLLMLRNDLQMTDKIEKEKEQKEEVKLTILPELRNYQYEKSRNKENPENNSRNQSLDFGEDKFESCVFVKTERGKKKANEFDEIDKYFNKKDKEILGRKWIPSKRNLSNHKTLEPTLDFASHKPSKSGELTKDPLQSVLKIFESHNKEVVSTRRGRTIKIPKLDLYKF